MTVPGPVLGRGAAWGFSSTLELFRSCLALRSEVFDHDDFAWVEIPGTISFRRRDIVSITNFSSSPIDLPAGRVLAASAECVGGRLSGDATAWLEAS